jgi:kynurenine formamidase
MCTAAIQKVVAERLQREGRPLISRRNFLRFGGVTAAGLAVAPSLAFARPSLQEMSEIVDLTHVLNPSVPTYPAPTVPLTVETIVTIKDNGFYKQAWTFDEHSGTHMDIPAHFVEGGDTVDKYAANLLVSPAVVIDIAARAEDDPDTQVTVDDLTNWESANGEIPPGAVVLMYSGWESRWNDQDAFRGSDADGGLHFPGFSGEAAQFLIEERDIHGIGVDTLSLDYGQSTTFDTHLTILSAGKYGIENVANLAQIKDKKATVVAGIPRYENGSGGPCRVLALPS